jgi:FAD/FMN-containing dehydrogenase
MNIPDNEPVIKDPQVLKTYAGDLSFARTVKPSYIFKPQTSDQVKRIVQLANETRTPLVPVSSGPPHFRGDTVPEVNGTAVVDLSGMNKIIRIDTKNRVAMIEPGVTFASLQPALEKAGLRLNMPLLPRLTKSVLGSALEREPVTLPRYQWDIADPLLCTEIVFGNGEMFRTGSAAGPATLERQWELGAGQEIPMGPGQVDWYRLIQGAQGTLGIVTWATVRCERLPEMEEAFLVESPDLESLSEFSYWLIRRRLVNECLVLNRADLAAILYGNRAGEYGSLRGSLPAWLLYFVIAGYRYYPEDRIDYQKAEMLEIAARLNVTPVPEIGQISAANLHKLLRFSSEEPYWKLCSRGSCYDIFFLATRDKLPDLLEAMSGVAVLNGYPTADIGTYIQPVVQGTACHCEFSLFFDPGNTTEVDRVRKLAGDAVSTLISKRAFFSRPYGPWADIVYVRDPGPVISLRKIKGILDPNNIMNPGKLCFQPIAGR